MAVFMNGTAVWSTTTFAEVTSWEIRVGGERVTHSADVDQALTWQQMVKKDTTITINCDDVAQVANLHANVGSAAATVTLVAKTADGGTDCSITGSAMVIGCNSTVQHASPDNSCSVELAAVSSDGSTMPILKS